MRKILITGSSGMLGKDIYKILSINKDNEIYAINRKIDASVKNSYDVDIREHLKVYSIINSINPDVIIHTAALVNVDFCEKNKDIAYEVNVNASKYLAKLTKRMIYISTDSVYNGFDGNFKETDRKNPINYYAETKSIAEDEIMRINPNSIIIRTNLYGYHTPLGKSLFEWAYENLSRSSEIKGFHDVLFNPLYTTQLAHAIKTLLENHFSGIINIGSEESLSKFEFLTKLANTFQFDERLIRPISLDEGLLGAKRPKNTILNLNKMKDVTGLSFSVNSGLEQLYKDFCKIHNR
ncbi:MAG: SDR family oxidoreductase [Lachnospiraceae bacterium]|nr:SDR family oxidoreductase [Lachnospiraceae bacterium]